VIKEGFGLQFGCKSTEALHELQTTNWKKQKLSEKEIFRPTGEAGPEPMKLQQFKPKLEFLFKLAKNSS
jgi:hypothetical protein